MSSHIEVSENHPTQDQNKYFFKFIWRLSSPYKTRLFWGALSIGLINALEMIPPLVFKDVGDKIQSGDFTYSSWMLALFFVVLYACMALLRWVWRWCFFVTSRHIEADIKNILFDNILNTSYSQASKLKIGNTVSLFSQDANEIRWFVGIVGLLIFDTSSYLFYIPFILNRNLGSAGLALMLPFMVIPFLMYWYEKKVNVLFVKSSDRQGKISDWVYEETVGAKVIRILSLYKIRRSKYGEILNELYETQLAIGRIDVIFDSVLHFLVYSSRALLFLFAFLAITKQNILLLQFAMIGNIIMVMRVLDRLVGPMVSFGEIATLTEKAKAAVKRMRPLLELPVQVSGGKLVSPPIEEITIKNLNFSFPQTTERVLHGINFEAKAGMKIGIVGHVGAGKTTFLKILSGLYMESEIDRAEDYAVNGISFKNISLPEYKRHISYLPQESVIFNASIFSNVTPDGSHDRQAVTDALAKAAMTQDLLTFPQGLETPIGEKGVNLSGGQKQRVSIARSMLSGAHLYLWDDTISALDIATERQVIHGLFPMNPRGILVLATHRPSALSKFDSIYVFRSGRVVEQGSFDELMSAQGEFYQLFQYEAKTREVRVGEVAK